MSARKKTRVVQRNGRLGIELPVLPPLRPTPVQLHQHVPHAQQQHEELIALRDAFRTRLRANAKLDDLAPLLQYVAAARRAQCSKGAPETDISRSVHAQQEDAASVIDASSDDCFAFLQRFTALLAPVFPFAAQFVALLTDRISDLVHDKLHAEAATAVSRSPRRLAIEHDPLNEASRVDGSSSSESDASSSSSDDNDDPVPSACASPRAHCAAAPRGNTFRHSLRCRAFPPTRVPEHEHIVTTCTYTPFDASTTASDLSSIHLEESAGSDGASQWRVVQFPKLKPSMSRNEADALIYWAQSKLALCRTHAPHEAAAFAAKQSHFERALALNELICYELTRLVFHKCPTTARFVHGLFVELVDTALRTVASADREAQITTQRQKNVELELERLATKLAGVRASLTSLEETLRKRQRHLLSDRERIIRQRKRLNILLCADQVLIRSVAALIQHLLDLADDLLTALTVDDPHGLLGSSLAHVVAQSDTSDDDDSSRNQRVALVDDLYELVRSKYASLREVQTAVQRVEQARMDSDAQTAEALGVSAEPAAAAVTGARSDHVVILDVDKVITATEDFKSALRRLSRLVSTKSPDSLVGWAAQELWDQALFIPPHEDIQDLDRDVLRLCKHVEATIVQRRHRVHGLACAHAAAQTDISACVSSFQPRSRANGFVSFPTSFAFDLEQQRRADTTETAAATTALRETADATPQHVRDAHQELLHKFLPPAFREYIHTIPSDYAPRQLSLSAVHAIISYLFNEMWLLVRDAYVAQPKAFAITATLSHAIPVASIHAYVYRIYLVHFRDPAFVTRRLLDLLVSASRLDTQSVKVLLFCRLLHLPGVDALSHDAFWFVLKTMHVLQRACASTGHYFHLDASGENEFVPQASASEALAILFRGASNDVMKRLRLRLAGLASVYGAIWIPASNVMEFVMDEWKTAQDTLRMAIAETVAAAAPTKHVPAFDAFLKVFSDLRVKVHRLEAAQAYRHLLVQSKRSTTRSGAHDSSSVDTERFRHAWVQLLLHAMNHAQQQQFGPSSSQQHGAGARPASSGIHFGSPSDALVAANRHLSVCFLKATWGQTKNDFIRALDVAFHDIGLQVRLIQQMDAVVNHEDAAAQVGWKRLQQLIQITATGKTAATTTVTTLS